MNSQHQYKRLVTNSFLFRLYMFRQLPMIWLAGIRVPELDVEHAVTSIRYRFLTKNPFRSIYFACLAMAAELSSGVLAMMHVRGANPKVSMLVTSLKADFTKKAVGKILFTCRDGNKISAAIAQTQKTGEGILVEVRAEGRDETGDLVASFAFTWSFRRKS
jgi:hypothetical protein